MPEPPPTDSLPEDEAAMEYKPWVKYTAWAGLGIGCLALAYYAFYSWGYASGSKAATEDAERQLSGVLQLAISGDTSLINEVAARIEASREDAEKSRSEKETTERSLTDLLNMPAANDAALLRMAADHRQIFGGIAKPDLKREALGVLLSALIDRSLLLQAEDLLDEVMPPAQTQEPLWAQRMLRAAHALALAGKWEKAKAYLQALDSGADSPIGTKIILRAWADLALAASMDPVNLQRELSGLADRAAAAGDKMLTMEFTVSLAHVCRDLGDEEMAKQHFREVVQAMAEEEEGVSGPAALLYGVALCESGLREQAIRFLNIGLDTTTHSPAIAPYRAEALRHLATLSLQVGHNMEALRYLYRAEGEASGIIDSKSSYWPCLADQMAWTLYAMHEYEDSLAEFRKAQVRAASEQEELCAQPMEGAALCCLALGRTQEAIQAAQECAALRERVLPHDKKRLGLVYLLLGQSYDQAGDLKNAADHYLRAATILPADMAEHTAALENRAQALTQAESWEAAAVAWEKLISALPEDAEQRRENAGQQLDACRRKISADAAPPSPPASERNVSSHRSSR